MGRADGIGLLDISSDGFWNSFFAIVIAAPVLVVGWVAYANDIATPDIDLVSRIGIVLRLGMADMAAWLLPIAGLAAVAGPAGIGDRFVHYVVASNWGSAITVWLMLPPSLMDLSGIEGIEDFVALLSLGLFAVALVLSWRLTNAALQRGPGPATLLFSGMLITSIFVLYSAQSLLGVLPEIRA